MMFFRTTRPIALISDFGTADGYAGSVKAVIASLAPACRVIDITHEIPRGNILSAAFVLYSVFDFLPGNTVVWAVVDPGVGTEREILCAQIGDRYIIAPDNGIISFLSRFKPEFPVYGCNCDSIARYTGKSISATFHGRDLFAPIAALVARGKRRVVKGRPLEKKPVLISEVFPEKVVNGIEGYVIHIDIFGNAVTSILADELPWKTENSSIRINECAFKSNCYVKTYTDVDAGDALLYTGSSGFLEIAVHGGSAAEKYGIRQGMRVLACRNS